MKIRKIIITYLLTFLFFTLLFVLSFHAPLFKTQTVLFYRGILLLLTTTIVCSLLLFLFRQKFKLETQSFIAALTISLSFHLSFFVIFPVTFDRSVTMYLLSTLAKKPASQNCPGIGKSALKEAFITEYVKENRAIERRIYEQSFINFVKEEKECVTLTSKGHRFLNFSLFIKKLYGIN